MAPGRRANVQPRLHRFYGLLLAHPGLVLGVSAVLTAFFAWKATGVEVNSSVEALLPEGHPAVTQDREVKRAFDSRELILIGFVDEADGIFRPGTLDKVERLTDAIRGLTLTTGDDAAGLGRWAERVPSYAPPIRRILDGGLDAADRGAVTSLWFQAREDDAVDPAFVAFLEKLRFKLWPVSNVISLASVDNITGSDLGLDVAPPMTRVPRTDSALARLAATVFDNEMFVNGLVSADSTGTVVAVELSFHYDGHLDLAYRLFHRLEALAAPYRGPEEVVLAGVPMVNVYTSSYMTRDMIRLMPLVVLVVLLIMLVSFRWLRGAFIPLAVVLVALIWTLGTMAVLGRPITLVVSAMPVILIAIGVADGIHLVTEYRLAWERLGGRTEAVFHTMEALTWPVVFTSLTDMAGFGSLAISSLASIRDFGVFTSVGVLVALVFSLTCIPAALLLMAPPGTRSGRSAPFRLEAGLAWLAEVTKRRRRAVVLGTVAVMAAAALLIPRINVGSTMVGYFHKKSEIYQASQLINEKFGGTEVLNVVVDTHRPDGLKDPAVLGAIAALQDTLESRSLVGYTTSLADYVKRINRVMHGGDAAYNRIPRATEQVQETDLVQENGREAEVDRMATVPGRDLIAQYLLLYEASGGEDVRKLASPDYSKANIVAQIRTDHTPQLREIRRVARDYASRALDGDVDVSFAGCSNLCIVADDLIIPSQLRSLAVAFVAVLALLMLVFGSVRHGLMGLLPLALTVVLVFGLLSAFGVYLDAVTALIASIVLGIGIDYSVHFLARYRALRREGLDADAAIHETMTTAGRAIVFNSLAVTLGFLVLLLSSFWAIMHIGWLVAVNMVAAAVFTLLLLPILLRREAATAARSGAAGQHERDDDA